ncbi:hypothetical protein SLS53_004013 [Cytospora paraplurivora]|uniref:Zn(2)-C6 fungal-type domain-containing protein n=1 Tax=Cytospora paraplurivora TaxID=2898453 RepID=A0AAN9YHS8_9PEZI
MSASAFPSARQASGAEKEVVYPLSCVNCRQRKVRCSKTYPCPNCVKGSLECVFPSRKKDRAPRRSKNNELLSRLAKLEAIVGQVDPDSLRAVAGASSHTSQDAGARATFSGLGSADAPEVADSVVAVDPTSMPANEAAESESSNPQERRAALQPALKADPAAKYVSGEFWANLSSEVEGIKATLEQPSDTEDDSDGGHGHDQTSPASASRGYQSSPSYYVTSSAVFGNAQAANAGEGMLHPAPEKMRRLLETYFRNVDPLIKILHRPTIERLFDGFMSSPVSNALSRTDEALCFAIYFAAITSLQPERCKALLGEDRGLLAVQYRQAAEYALARADYLNSTSLETLQALTLYSTCLRNHAESRASWAMLALVLRLSQAIGIHRDNDGRAFSPYEAEMRRRLWSQIIVLDVRAAQDRGTEPMVRQEEYNTLPPTNLNDSDFGPQTTVPVSQLAREGPTDITFCLCTYGCSKLFLYIHGPRSRFSKADHETTATTATSTTTTTPRSLPQSQINEEDLVQRIKQLETQFNTPAADQPGNFQSALAASVLRIASLIYWLSIEYPWQVRRAATAKQQPRVSRENVLRTAVAIMELQASGPSSAAIGPDEYRERFIWWQDGYVQWHALAVALAELCAQTRGGLVDRAWATVDRVLPGWSDKVADTRKGALWRPIRKLLRRARERRAEAQMMDLRIDGEEGTAQEGSEGAQTAHQQQPMTGHAVSPRRLTRPSYDTTAGAGATYNPTAPGLTAEAGTASMPSAQDLGTVPDLGRDPTTAAPPAFILTNDHNPWKIDFGDIGATTPDGAAAGTQDLDVMDWSYWNEFVNDAGVGFDTHHTSPSSEET